MELESLWSASQKRKDHHDLRKRLYLECWWRLEFSTKKLFYKAMRCWPVVLSSVNIKYLQCGSKFCIQMCHDVIDWIQGICVLALYWWIYPSSYLIQLDFFHSATRSWSSACLWTKIHSFLDHQIKVFGLQGKIRVVFLRFGMGWLALVP